MVTDISKAEHYTWGEVCDGWILCGDDGLSVIQERMPPGGKEVRHLHKEVQQFFFVLDGELTIEVGRDTAVLKARQGMHMTPRRPHLVRNNSAHAVEFLVISQPKVRGDRVRVED